MFSFVVGVVSLVPLRFPTALGRRWGMTGTQRICWLADWLYLGNRKQVRK